MPDNKKHTIVIIYLLPAPSLIHEIAAVMAHRARFRLTSAAALWMYSANRVSLSANPPCSVACRASCCRNEVRACDPKLNSAVHPRKHTQEDKQVSPHSPGDFGCACDSLDVSWRHVPGREAVTGRAVGLLMVRGVPVGPVSTYDESIPHTPSVIQPSPLNPLHPNTLIPSHQHHSTTSPALKHVLRLKEAFAKSSG